MKRLLFSTLLLFGGLCSVLSAEQPVPSAGEKFSFVQMCDTQLGMGGYEHDVKTFTLAVDQINKMKPDFVVICGDLVNKADEKSWADFNRIKAGFVIPCHCAAGNHDVENVPTAKSLRFALGHGVVATCDLPFLTLINILLTHSYRHRFVNCLVPWSPCSSQDE